MNTSIVRNLAPEKIAFTRFQMPCGKPALLSDVTSEMVSIAEMLGVKPENLLICPAVGDSMVDEGISEGDLIFADSSLIAKLNDVVLAEIDGELSVKKIERMRPDLRLVSCNIATNYKPIVPRYGFHVIGVIVGSFKFRKPLHGFPRF